MSRTLTVLRCGPGVTVQDTGRPGYLGFGLSRGGAADRLALHEGAALLGQDPGAAAIEMPGSGGQFEAGADLRIALTGAAMAATLDGTRLAWNASHAMPKGSRLTIGGVSSGTYGYLHVGGGIAGEPLLGSRAAHLVAGLRAPLAAGDVLEAGTDPAPDKVGFGLVPEARFDGGTVRVLPTPQTRLFAESERDRFAATRFRRDARGNRMGVRFDPEGGGGFAAAAGLSVLSEIVVPGDIQIAGEGSPFVLLAECQTTGGYPRIGTVIPADLPRVAQTGPGGVLRFRFIDFDEARRIEAAERGRRAGLKRSLTRLVRRPEDMHDLLAYQLIGGVTAGEDLEAAAG